MGNEYGDAQNIAVRVFLNQFSKKFNTFFDDEYKQKTLKYFNYQCPYSGEDISDGNFVMDHIVPFNRECCGLHVYGNILLVTKEANKNKHHHSLEKFLKNEPERLEKIKRFMEESGFAGIHEIYNKQLCLNCESLYKKVRTVIETDFRDFISVVKIHDKTAEFKDSIKKTNDKTPKPTESPLNTYEIINSKITFKLLDTDRNNNKYYIFPENEDDFKKEAFQDKEIFVRVKHSDGYVENITRQVNKVWGTSVYWNINSMPTSYRGLNHLSKAHDLVVHSFPIRYKDKIII